MLWLLFVTSIRDPCSRSLNQCLPLTRWPSGGCSAGTTVALDYKTHFMHLFHYHLWPSSKWLQINFSYMETGPFFHRTEAWTIFISCHFSSHTNITFQPHQKSCRSLCKPGLFMSSCLCVHCSFSPGFLLWPLFYLNCFSFFRTFLDIRLFGKLLRLPGAVRRSLFMVPIVLLALPSLYYNYFSAFVFFLLA